MEIKLNYQALGETAKGIMPYLISKDGDGMYVINHLLIKSFAKIYLWLVLDEDNEKVQRVIDELDQEVDVQELYCRLEDEGELEISKKDLAKYKFYIDIVYNTVKTAEASNELKAQKAMLKLSEQTQSLVEAFNYIGEQIGSLNKEELEKKAETIDSLLKEIGQSN